MQELARFRTRFLLVSFAAGTNWRSRLVIDILGPYHIHHLDKFTSYFDVAAGAILLAAVGDPVKHRTPSAAGADRTVSGLYKCPLERSISTRA